jgi:hypothetical protein
MTVQVTLTLPDAFLTQAQQWAGQQQRDVSLVLADALQQLWPLLELVPDPLSERTIQDLLDPEIVAMADLKLEQSQNERLGELQSKGKSLGLTELEQFELLMLIQVYRLGQLRKSEGLAEAVRRGLRAPLAA